MKKYLLVLAIFLVGCSRAPDPYTRLIDNVSKPIGAHRQIDIGGDYAIVAEVCVDGYVYYASASSRMYWVIGGAKFDSDGKPLKCNV